MIGTSKVNSKSLSLKQFALKGLFIGVKASGKCDHVMGTGTGKFSGLPCGQRLSWRIYNSSPQLAAGNWTLRDS
jgi:hypothetical protein